MNDTRNFCIKIREEWFLLSGPSLQDTLYIGLEGQWPARIITKVGHFLQLYLPLSETCYSIQLFSHVQNSWIILRFLILHNLHTLFYGILHFCTNLHIHSLGFRWRLILLDGLTDSDRFIMIFKLDTQKY